MDVTAFFVFLLRTKVRKDAQMVAEKTHKNSIEKRIRKRRSKGEVCSGLLLNSAPSGLDSAGTGKHGL